MTLFYIHSNMVNVYVAKLVLFDCKRGTCRRKTRLYSTVKSANDFAHAELKKLFKEHEAHELADLVTKRDQKTIKYNSDGCLKVKGELDCYTNLTLIVYQANLFGPDTTSGLKEGGGATSSEELDEKKSKAKKRRRREDEEDEEEWVPDWDSDEEEWKSGNESGENSDDEEEDADAPRAKRHRAASISFAY